MKKIDFVNGTTIDGASTFNQMQDNIEEVFNGEEAMGSIVVDDIGCKNLLYTPYTETNKWTITATRDDYFEITDYNCYLEAGKTYAVSFESDGEGGGTAGTDTVQLWLLKDKEYDYKYSFSSKKMTFVPEATGYYYFRADVNKNGTTHSFWNIQVELGDTTTPYTPYKRFDGRTDIISGVETPTNEYVDGKRVYTKEFHIGTPQDTTRWMTPHGITDIDRIWVDMSHSYIIHNNKTSIGFNDPREGYTMGVYVDSTNIVTQTYGNGWSGWVMWVTLKYTKATDVSTIETTSLEETE